LKFNIDPTRNVEAEAEAVEEINFCGSWSTLKKEAGNKLRSIWLFEEPEAEAFFIK